MAETPEAPASPATVTDNRPVPRGVLPRGVQTWIMAGIAVGMLAIMLLVGRSDPPARGLELTDFRIGAYATLSQPETGRPGVCQEGTRM